MLLAAFYQEQVGRYGFADPVELDSGPGERAGVFAVVYHNGLPVGCGGYRAFGQDGQTVEIRKVYVMPSTRGRGIGRALLRWLEGQAKTAGANQVVLETGVRNTAAMGMFASLGYYPVSGYVPGRDPAINRAFARSLLQAP